MIHVTASGLSSEGEESHMSHIRSKYLQAKKEALLGTSGKYGHKEEFSNHNNIAAKDINPVKSKTKNQTQGGTHCKCHKLCQNTNPSLSRFFWDSWLIKNDDIEKVRENT